MKKKWCFVWGIFLVSQMAFGLTNSLKTFYVGFEVSELLQNNFQNLGFQNMTFLFGQEGLGKKAQFGYRFSYIGVELNEKHLAENPFLEGDTEGLEGTLRVLRGGLDWFPWVWGGEVFRFFPIGSVTIGYTQIVFTKGDVYDFQTFSVGSQLRCQWEMWRWVFVEFPLLDVGVSMVKNRSAGGEVVGVSISYPEWGVMFFWITVGVKVRW
ncbi:MAG: hypothetical protein HPY78_04725 [Brevinematales bacterium]|nr:hypothetical protein [Brevinematales bacterium]